MKSTAYRQSEERNGKWACITPEPIPQNPQIQEAVSSYLLLWVRVDTEEDNEGRMKRWNEGTLLGPTWCVPWTGAQGQLSSGHLSIYSSPILDYSSTWYIIWKRIRLSWKVPHQLTPPFLFLSVSLLRAIQQLAREQCNQASCLWVCIPGGFPSAWPCPVLLLASWFQIWRTGT